MDAQSSHSSHDRDPVDTNQGRTREGKHDDTPSDATKLQQQKTSSEGPLHMVDLGGEQETELSRLRAEVQRKDEVIQNKNEQIEYLQKCLSELSERLWKLEGHSSGEHTEHQREFESAKSSHGRKELSSVDEHFEREFPSASTRRKLREEINFFEDQLKQRGDMNAPHSAHGEEAESLVDYLQEYELHPSAVRGRSKYSPSVFDTMRRMNKHMNHWQRKNPMEEYSTLSMESNPSLAKTQRELDLEEIQRLQRERDRLYENIRNIDESRYKEVLSKSDTFLRQREHPEGYEDSYVAQQGTQSRSIVDEASREARYKSFLDKSAKFQNSVSRLSY